LADYKRNLLQSGGFESVEHLKDELFKYMIYYNEIRPHQSLNGKAPVESLKIMSTN
jgi:transposase InsO family protein